MRRRDIPFENSGLEQSVVLSNHDRVGEWLAKSLFNKLESPSLEVKVQDMVVEAVSSKEDVGPSTRRIEALSDGIFAIAMTLLVLSLRLPGTSEHESLHDLLFGQMHVFVAYALSFILLAIFWIIHHQHFHSIVRTNRVHLWINIIILLFVALMPFSSSLVGDYPSESLSKGFFDLNMFALGMLFYGNWWYASKNHRLIDPDLSEERITMVKRKGQIIPAVSLVAFSLSMVVPDWSSLAYLLIPFLLFHPHFREAGQGSVETVD